MMPSSRLRTRKSLSLKLIASAGIAVAAIATMAQYGGQNVDIWWEAGDGRALPMFVTFPDSTGELMVLNNDGAIRTRDHAFFDAKGVNGRACITCHQPSAAMSLAAAEVRDRWKETAQGSRLRRHRRLQLPHPPPGRTQLPLPPARPRPLPHLPPMARRRRQARLLHRSRPRPHRL